METPTRAFPIDGWVALADVIVEMTMSLDRAHRPVLRRIAMAMATTGSIFSPDAEIGPLGPYIYLTAFLF